MFSFAYGFGFIYSYGWEAAAEAGIRDPRGLVTDLFGVPARVVAKTLREAPGTGLPRGVPIQEAAGFVEFAIPLLAGMVYDLGAAVSRRHRR